MAHEVEAFIAPPSALAFLPAAILRCRLDLGFVLIPIPWDASLPLSCPCAQDPDAPFPEFRRLTVSALDFAAGLSVHTPLAYVETGYFGGTGDQAAMVLRNGYAQYGPIKSRSGAINGALRRLGVPTGERADEFDVIGLWRNGTTHDWLAQAQTGGTDAERGMEPDP